MLSNCIPLQMDAFSEVRNKVNVGAGYELGEPAIHQIRPSGFWNSFWLILTRWVTELGELKKASMVEYWEYLTELAQVTWVGDRLTLLSWIEFLSFQTVAENNSTWPTCKFIQSR